MIDILATVNWEDILLVGAALGIFGGTKSLYNSITKKNGNSNGKFNKALCEERHKTIDAVLVELKDDMREGFKTIFKKLDSLYEHIGKK